MCSFNVDRFSRICPISGEDVSIKEYRPFVYIDVSYAPLLSLHVQPLPEVYNVTGYKVWLINNDTDFAKAFNMTSEQDFRYNFTAHTGVFYFKVAAMHLECGDYGCVNSTTPFIIIREYNNHVHIITSLNIENVESCIILIIVFCFFFSFAEETSHRLLIMIISTVWIPPVILYVLYHLYKLYRKGKVATSTRNVSTNWRFEIFYLVHFCRSSEKERETKMFVNLLTDETVAHQRDDRAGEIFKSLRH